MTERQQRFYDAYCHGPKGVRYNASKSAALAGYAWPNRQGSRLMQLPNVGRLIRAEINRQCEASRARHRVEMMARVRALHPHR